MKSKPKGLGRLQTMGASMCGFCFLAPSVASWGRVIGWCDRCREEFKLW